MLLNHFQVEIFQHLRRAVNSVIRAGGFSHDHSLLQEHRQNRGRHRMANRIRDVKADMLFVKSLSVENIAANPVCRLKYRCEFDVFIVRQFGWEKITLNLPRHFQLLFHFLSMAVFEYFIDLGELFVV